MKIIFLSKREIFNHLVNQLLDRFSSEPEVDMFVWDCSPILLPVINTYDTNRSEVDNKDYTVTYQTQQELVQAIQNLDRDNTLIILPFGIDKKAAFVFRAIYKNKIKYLVFKTGGPPGHKSFMKYFVKSKFTGTRQKLRLLLRFVEFSYIKRLKNRTLCKFEYKSPDYVYAFSPHNIKTKLKDVIGKNTKVIKGHISEYDTYLNLSKEKSRFRKGRYAVFIDQGFSYNSDFLLLDKFPVSDIYYQELETLFQKLEEKHGFEVVFSAHPKAKPENLLQLSRKRKIYYGKTPALIKDSEMVLGHYSSSLSLAMLFRKKVLFCLTSELIGTPFENQIRYMANKIQSTVTLPDAVDIDIPEPDVAAYDKYINRYVKFPGGIEENSWSVISKKINLKLSGVPLS